MRISGNPDDRAWHPHFGYVKVFLEGCERNNVQTADEEARFAITFKLDEFGRPVKGKDGKTVLETFRGPVRIECADWLRQAMEAPQGNGDETLAGAVYAMIHP